jgi:hypothetical protein
VEPGETVAGRFVYTITVSGPGGTFTQTAAAGAGETVFSVTPGSWTVAVTGSVDGVPVAQGSSAVTVTGGEKQHVTVDLDFFDEAAFDDDDPATEDTLDGVFTVRNAAGWGNLSGLITGTGTNYIIIVADDIAGIEGLGSSDYSFDAGFTGVVSILGSGSLTLGDSESHNGSLLRISENQTVILRDVTLKGHTANNAPLVYVDGGTLTTYSGAVITGNTNTAGNGGGVYMNGGSFAMEGGMIRGNAALNGSGVYNDGSFSMSGDALMEADNDVYLAVGKTITVAGPLTRPVAATITPAVYMAQSILTPGFPADSPGKFIISGSGYYLTAEGKLGNNNIILATLSNQKVDDIHFVSPSEIYVLSWDDSTKTYYLSKWNGSSLATIDTVVKPGSAMYGRIAYRNANEYYAIYRDGSAIGHSTVLRKYVNGTTDSEITIPWQYGSVEASFDGFEFFDNRLFLAAYAKSDLAKVFTVTTSPLTFDATPVYTKTNPGAWSYTPLETVNNNLYFVRGANSGSVAQVILAKWNGAGFTELCVADTTIPGAYGLFPVGSAVKDDGTVFVATNFNPAFSPFEARLDKLTVISPSDWTTVNIYNYNPPNPPNKRLYLAGDTAGYWLSVFDNSTSTYEISRFDYGTDSKTASYTGLPFGSPPGLCKYDSGDSGHFAHAVMPNTTDTELWLVTLPGGGQVPWTP